MNKSSKKRTLSETLEDQLLTETTQPEDDEDDDQPETKRRNTSQTSDVDESEEVHFIDLNRKMSCVFFFLSHIDR